MKLKRIPSCILAAVIVLSMQGNVFAAGINEIGVEKEVKNVILLIVFCNN